MDARSCSAREPSAPNPWQAPPAFLWHALIDQLLQHEPPRVALLCIAPLRQVSADWRAAVGAMLPVLAPRPHVPIDELAAAASHLPGLQLLCIEGPGTTRVQRADITAEQATALSVFGAACPGLRSLHLLKWQHLEEAALEPLSTLTALHTLEIVSQNLHVGAAGLAALARLPRLRCLALRCRRLDCAGLAALPGLTSLDLSPGTLDVEAALLPSLAELTGLRHLGLDGLGGAALAGLGCLTTLPQLSSLALQHADLSSPEGSEAQPLQALLELVQALGGGSDGQPRRGLRQLRLASSRSDPDAAASLLPLAALRGLESLGVAYPGLQVAPRDELAGLSGLTELALDVLLLEEQHEAEDVAAFVAAACRRLTGLRRLHLLGAQRLEEVVLEQLAGLTGLTSLSLDQAYDFGGRALAALAPLASLRRLSLSGISLNRASLLGVLSEAEEEEEEHPQNLLPGLTYLALRNCRLLSGPEVAQLVLALPSLRRFLHRSWPALQSAQLRCILEQKAGLQLLQTTWRPAAAPDLPAAPAEPSQRQREQRQRHEEDAALCRAFRLRLQHSLPSESGLPSVAPLFAWDPEQALTGVLHVQA
ncbi:hypothetical protein ABPG75_008679 [Micractinium tetrahymenae]